MRRQEGNRGDGKVPPGQGKSNTNPSVPAPWAPSGTWPGPRTSLPPARGASQSRWGAGRPGRRQNFHHLCGNLSSLRRRRLRGSRPLGSILSSRLKELLQPQSGRRAREPHRVSGRIHRSGIESRQGDLDLDPATRLYAVQQTAAARELGEDPPVQHAMRTPQLPGMRLGRPRQEAICCPPAPEPPPRPGSPVGRDRPCLERSAAARCRRA